MPCFVVKNIGLLGHKPPYFRCKTSVLCGKEVRCFLFSGRKWRKNSLFLILRYFGARQVMVASDALLGPLTTWSGRLDASENGRWKILHTCPFFMNPWHSGYNCFGVHRLCKNRLTSFVGAGIRAFGAAMHVHILPEAAGMSLNHAGKLIKIAFLSSLACRNATKPASFIRSV